MPTPLFIKIIDLKDNLVYLSTFANSVVTIVYADGKSSPCMEIMQGLMGHY